MESLLEGDGPFNRAVDGLGLVVVVNRSGALAVAVGVSVVVSVAIVVVGGSVVVLDTPGVLVVVVWVSFTGKCILVHTLSGQFFVPTLSFICGFIPPSLRSFEFSIKLAVSLVLVIPKVIALVLLFTNPAISSVTEKATTCPESKSK